MDLNDLIMQKQQAIGRTYADYQQGVAGMPEFESQTRQQVFGGDQGLKDLMGGFSDKVMELYNYDKNRASTYSAPISAGGQEFVANPMIAEQATMTGFNQIAREKENAWQLYETRKNLLGSVVDKALRLYEAKLEGKKMDIARAKDEFDASMDLFKETNRMAESKRELDLKEKEAKGSIPVTGVQEVDSMDNDSVLMEFTRKFGPSAFANLKGDTDAKITQARSILAQGEMGETPLYLNTAGDQVQMGGLAAGYKQAEQALGKFEKEPSVLGGLFGTKTGPWISKMGTTGWGGEFRNLVANLSKEKINQTFGGALTATEADRLKFWAVEPNMQEQQVYRNIKGMMNEARLIYEEKMRSAGYPENYIKQKIGQMFPTNYSSEEIPDNAVQEGF